MIKAKSLLLTGLPKPKSYDEGHSPNSPWTLTDLVSWTLPWRACSRDWPPCQKNLFFYVQSTSLNSFLQFIPYSSQSLWADSIFKCAPFILKTFSSIIADFADKIWLSRGFSKCPRSVFKLYIWIHVLCPAEIRGNNILPAYSENYFLKLVCTMPDHILELFSCSLSSKTLKHCAS